MQAQLLSKAVLGSFGVSHPDEVAAVRFARNQGWIDAIVSEVSSHLPLDGPQAAPVMGITLQGRERLSALHRRPLNT